MHGLEAEYWGRLDFVYIDRENPANQLIVERYVITYQPVFLLISPTGEVSLRFTGFDENDIRDTLDAHLAQFSN